MDDTLTANHDLSIEIEVPRRPYGLLRQTGGRLMYHNSQFLLGVGAHLGGVLPRALGGDALEVAALAERA